MTEEQKARLQALLKEIQRELEQVDRGKRPDRQEEAPLPALQGGYVEVLMRRFTKRIT
jgi:hypothetical protein